jgi:hypothetical protein
VELDSLVHAPRCLFPCAAGSDAAGEVRRIGRVVAAGALNDDQEPIHRSLPSLRPSQASLLENTGQGSRRQVITRMPCNCDAPQLARMLVLSMAALRHNQEPAIILYQPNDVSDLHLPGPRPTTEILAWSGKGRLWSQPSRGTQQHAQRFGSAAEAGLARLLLNYAPLRAKRACARAAKSLSDWSRCWAATHEIGHCIHPDLLLFVFIFHTHFQAYQIVVRLNTILTASKNLSYCPR